MNNFQKIKTMTESELADYLYLFYVTNCNNCPCGRHDYKECLKDDCDCHGVVEKWLKKRNEIGIC